MNIYVCIKQVPDTETKIKLSSDQNSIDPTNIKWILNPYDEYAVEEALQLKKANPDSKVKVISLGPKARVTDSVRTALAMGADEAIIIDGPETIDSLVAAQAVAKTIQQEGAADIIFTGKLSIDDGTSAFAQQLAEFLEIPHTTVISKFSAEGTSYTVERDVEGGAKEIVQMNGPCVVSANKGLNQPKYPSLPGIMKAKKKPLKEIEFASLGINADQSKVIFKNYQMPAEKPPVKILAGDASAQASELTQLLRNEAKVI